MRQRISRRIDKKRHQYWLDLGVIDASQQTYWRKKLFESTTDQVFVIDQYHHVDLCPVTIAAIKKYELSYSVKKVDASEAAAWLSQGGLVVFKFWANHYPTVQSFSGNNPELY